MYSFFLDAFSTFALFLVLISLIMVFFWYGFLWAYPICSLRRSNQSIGKDSDAGRDWGQEEKGTPGYEMAGWHH